MTLQQIESQVLELLVNLLQASGPALANQFLVDLVKLIQSYIPTTTLITDKIAWVDVRNELEAELEAAGQVVENTVIQNLFQAITTLITSYTDQISWKP
jgi:hypothetical protein